MPAIDIDQLTRQVEDLKLSLDNPDGFLSKFHDILSRYNNWALRQNPINTPRTLLQTYKLPSQVIRQIELGLLQAAEANPHAALILANRLWQDNYIESKELACAILGSLPIGYHQLVIDRIQDWVVPMLDKAALSAVLTKASLRIRRELPEEWDKLISSWLSNHDLSYQVIGLKAIGLLLDDPDTNHIPSVFTMVRPFIQEGKDNFSGSILEIIEALVKSTPIETLYYLKQILADTSGEEVEISMRRYADFFEVEMSKKLLDAVKDHKNYRLGVVKN